MDKFPSPKYNSLIDHDPQIIKIDLDHMDWAARKSSMPTNVKNEMTIKHVGGND